MLFDCLFLVWECKSDAVVAIAVQKLCKRQGFIRGYVLLEQLCIWDKVRKAFNASLAVKGLPNFTQTQLVTLRNPCFSPKHQLLIFF